MKSEREIVDRICERGPFGDKKQAHKALAATLTALNERLYAEERARIAGDLPAELARLLPALAPRPKASAEEFLRQAAGFERVRAGIGVEHAQIVCSVLAEVLTASTRELLSRKLPDLARLFELTEKPESPLLEPTPVIGAPHDLAEGRPGGTHPLATARGTTLAHRHSVARSTDPHADTRLSSAKGTAQERDDRTLATGRPGSRRPVSRSH